jgi:putative CRISPR-associated protein (TIGR02619 family)
MSKVLFITVGTTALTASDLGKVKNHEPLRRKAKHFLENSDQRKREQMTDEFRDELVKAHSLHPPGIEYLRHPYRTSAEMTSTYWLLQDDEPDLPGPFHHDGGDRLVLLASDTPEGELCAKVNAVLMSKLFFGCRCSQAECAAVKTHTIKGLEASQMAGPIKIRKKIAEIMHPYAEASRYFNITGGFKGAVPAIADLCATEFNPCPIFYQHETSASSVRIDLPERSTSASSAEIDGNDYRVISYSDVRNLRS